MDMEMCSTQVLILFSEFEEQWSNHSEIAQAFNPTSTFIIKQYTVLNYINKIPSRLLYLTDKYFNWGSYKIHLSI